MADEETIKRMNILSGYGMPVIDLQKAFGIEVPAQDAQYSTHAIAMHLLSQPDRLVEYGCEGIELSEDDLGEPAKPYVPPVLTKEEQERRDSFLNCTSKTVSFRPNRVYFDTKEESL